MCIGLQMCEHDKHMYIWYKVTLLSNTFWETDWLCLEIWIVCTQENALNYASLQTITVWRVCLCLLYSCTDRIPTKTSWKYKQHLMNIASKISLKRGLLVRYFLKFVQNYLKERVIEWQKNSKVTGDSESKIEINVTAGRQHSSLSPILSN